MSNTEEKKCIQCKNTSTNFTLRKNKEYYKTCNDCRKIRTKSTVQINEVPKEREREVKKEGGKEGEKEGEKEKKKTRNYTPPPRVCYFILKEQKYECRGPGKNDCDAYQCPLKVANIKFSDQKSPDPEIDHILPVSEGGSNHLENFQALCGCCHNKKSTLEGLIKSNNGIEDPLIMNTYRYLSRPKCPEESSDSDDELYDILSTRNRRSRRGRSRRNGVLR